MSERYFLTGVQLGMLKMYVVDGAITTKSVLDIIEDIERNQFVGNVKNNDKVVIR